MALKAIDFFCGIGGVTRGFLNKGIDVFAGIDIDESCKETYEANNVRSNGNPSRFLCEDITTFDKSKLAGFYSLDDKLIVIGCAPCQPFTYITKNLDGRHKERNLLLNFSRIILDLKPEYIFLENVEGLSSPKNKKILFFFINSLKPFYNLRPEVVDAANYGVPQLRKRMILFGKRNGYMSYPPETHGGRKSPLVTVQEAIGHLPPIAAGERHSVLAGHVSQTLTPIGIERLKNQDTPGDGMEKWPTELQISSRKDKGYTGHKDVYARLWWDRPSGTLTTKFTSISNGRFAHPLQNRGLSLLEGLLIQTFPENYQLCSPYLRTNAKHIGNAVPVKLAEMFAQQILDSEANKKVMNVVRQPELGYEL